MHIHDVDLTDDHSVSAALASTDYAAASMGSFSVVETTDTTGTGTGGVMSHIALHTEANLYVGKVPRAIELPASYKGVSGSVRESMVAMMIGFRAGREDELRREHVAHELVRARDVATETRVPRNSRGVRQQLV